MPSQAFPGAPAIRGKSRRTVALRGMGLLSLALFALCPGRVSGSEPSMAAGASAISENLIYQRLVNPSEELSDRQASDASALVIDLRAAGGGERSAGAIIEWLRGHGREDTPVYVLLSGETDPAIRAALMPERLPPGVISLAAAGGGVAADIEVLVSPSQDHAAYEALAAGQPVAGLIQSSSSKPRNDEAAIARRRANGQISDPVVPENAQRQVQSDDVEPALIDGVLQRAVQIHAGLTALGRVR